MLFTASALLALVAPLVAAQTTRTVTVGQGGLVFNPTNITANAGDIVTFQFVAKNHTVTQSTFGQPCTQLVNSTVNPPIIGISSGYMAVPQGSTQFPTWSIQIQDTAPLWFFCLQGNHCQQGMVFSVNPTPDRSHETFLATARASVQSVAAPQTGGAQTPPSGNGGVQNGIPNGNTGVVGGNQPGVVPTNINGAPLPTGTQIAGAARNLGGASLAVTALAVMLGVAL